MCALTICYHCRQQTERCPAPPDHAQHCLHLLSFRSASLRTAGRIPTPCRVLEAYLDGLVLLAGGRLCYCGPYSGGPAFLACCGHAQMPGQAPADFMLSVLSDPTAAAAAADAWAAAHPAPDAALGSKPACSQAAVGAAGSEDGKDNLHVDVEGGAPAAAVPQAMLAAARRQGTFRRLHRQPQPVNSISLINGLGPGRGGGPCTALVGLLLEVRVLAARNLRWMRRQPATTATIFATSAIGGGMLGLVFWQMTDNVEDGVRARQSLLYCTSLFGTYYGEPCWVADKLGGGLSAAENRGAAVFFAALDSPFIS